MAATWFHPRRAALEGFLERGGHPDVERHVERCDRCADRLVRLDGGAERGRLRDALAQALRPPADLSERVFEGVASSEAPQPELELFASLFSIGIDTARLMLPPEPDQPGQTGTDVSDPTGGTGQ